MDSIINAERSLKVLESSILPAGIDTLSAILQEKLMAGRAEDFKLEYLAHEAIRAFEAVGG